MVQIAVRADMDANTRAMDEMLKRRAFAVARNHESQLDTNRNGRTTIEIGYSKNSSDTLRYYSLPTSNVAYHFTD